jgi:hypothetical protein
VLAATLLVASFAGVAWATSHLTASHTRATSPNIPRATSSSASATGTATLPAHCPALAAQSSAAATLKGAQMTTGVRDAARKDYRPIDAATEYRVGQDAYLTFQIATKQAGTVNVEFCTASRSVNGKLAVPANSLGRYGEFSVHFAEADIGPGVAILAWNGSAVTGVRYSVRP